VVFEQAVLMGALALLTALLARADRPAGTIVAAGSTVMAGIVLWAPRPFLIGLIGTAVLLLLVERRRSPWWLVPVLWVWVNSHGSFPLGIAWLVARYVGAAIDERRRPRWLEPYALAFVVGLAVAAVNPLGPRLLAFPLVVQAHHKVFQLIIEWRSPNFQLGYALAALTALSVGLLFLLRRGAPWADVLPVVGFLVAGLISERNLPFAAIVLAPALGRALSAGTSPPVARPANPSGLPPPVVPALVIAGIALVVFSTRTSPVDLNGYPVAGERYLAAHGLLTTGHRIAAADVVGDFREFVEGPKGNVFIDDRYDMFPTAVVDDSQAIAAGQGTALDVLRRRNIDIVLWKRGEGPMSLLHAVGGWRTIYSDAHWEIMQRTPSLS
jgi:hypothetical protein